jgi:hypothetical protein
MVSNIDYDAFKGKMGVFCASEDTVKKTSSSGAV